jgi:pimeloyl-ACP methyl ester carboxylesterase
MAPWPLVGAGWETLRLAEQGAGEPVLLVHGQPGSSEDWEPVVADLAGDHRVLVVDRPGYGASALEVRSMEGNAELLADLVLARVGRPVVVAGHSYGGGVALRMAARRPEAVAGLTLVSSVGTRATVNGVDHLLASPGLGAILSGAGLFTLGRVLPRVGALVRHLPSAAAQRLRLSLPDDRYGAEVSRAGLRLWRSFLAEQRALVAEIGDVEAAIGRVRVPTAVVTGTRDVVVPPGASAELAARIPGAELVVAARTGHFAARDAPAAVAAAVRRTARRAGGADRGAAARA